MNHTAEYLREWRAKNSERSREHSKRYREANKEAISEHNKAYRKANREKVLARERASREKHPDSAQASRDQWVLNNPDKNLASKAKRRAGALYVPDANQDTIRVFYDQAHRLQMTLGIPFAVDHIIPLSAGGLHHERNLQVIPKSINSSKNKKILAYPIWATPEFSL